MWRTRCLRSPSMDSSRANCVLSSWQVLRWRESNACCLPWQLEGLQHRLQWSQYPYRLISGKTASGPWSPTWRQVDCEAAMCPCGKEGQAAALRGELPVGWGRWFLLCFTLVWVPSGMLWPVLGSPGQERHWQTGGNPTKGTKMTKGLGHTMSEERLR